MSPKWALKESMRCLSCYDPPCVEACPVHVDVAGFIRRVKTGDLRGASRLLRENLFFPNTCALVCPHLRFCEGACCIKDLTGPIRIGALQHFVAELEEGTRSEEAVGEKGKRVAIIGSGPAGLAAAKKLREVGHDITIFEKGSKPGGLLKGGIPPYRLPGDVPTKEIVEIGELSLKIERIDRVDELLEKFDAVLIATGAHESLSLNIPGEELRGVVKGLGFIKEFDRGSLSGKKVAVIGGGDVAIDAARCAVRLNAERVYLVYRRSFEEMPAYPPQIEEAQKENIWFLTQTMPIRIIGDEVVKSIECIKTGLGEPDDSGRRRPIPIPESKFAIDVDMVIEAIGQRVEKPFIQSNPRIEFEGGLIKVERSMTSLKGVFAAGDAVNGGSTVVQSIADGRRAATEIDRYLRGER